MILKEDGTKSLILTDGPPCRTREERGFFMGMQCIKPMSEKQSNGMKEEDQIQEELSQRRPGRNRSYESDLWDSHYLHTWNIDIFSQVICEEHHLVPQLRQTPQPLINANWSTPWGEEGFRGYHQDFHVELPINWLLFCKGIGKALSLRLMFPIQRISRSFSVKTLQDKGDSLGEEIRFPSPRLCEIAVGFFVFLK